ncbi:hypothetical protein PHMEG_00031985 [Phytophthora megakarya]|uniref:Uncharacterized protein n=1 Tax=Phytophthora megakarya TaxID=4795 RepID=A0A225UWG1_9STRA|nr:hypothetical protein PHMEG_00031985 [Phytophthora megakarya]
MVSCNESSKNIEFNMKAGGITSPSYQHDKSSKEAVAKNEAFKKQFIASQATFSMAQPSVFRR